MPTYEYRCEKCHQAFDAFQSMKDDAYKICPQKLCKVEPWGEGTVKRQLGTGAGLIFKGSGFYITDYRSEGYKDAAKKESGASKKDSDAAVAPAAGESTKSTPKPSSPGPSGSSGSSGASSSSDSGS